jgi:hypothetical protein
MPLLVQERDPHILENPFLYGNTFLNMSVFVFVILRSVLSMQNIVKTRLDCTTPNLSFFTLL